MVLDGQQQCVPVARLADLLEVVAPLGVLLHVGHGHRDLEGLQDSAVGLDDQGLLVGEYGMVDGELLLVRLVLGRLLAVAHLLI